MSKERIYTALALIFAFVQTLLPTMKFDEVETTIATTILLTLVSVFTLMKQRVSVEINKNAKILTWVLIGIAALGGINELVGNLPTDIAFKIHISNLWQERLRTIIAALIGILNIASKNLFPTEEGKVIEETKKDLKAAQ